MRADFLTRFKSKITQEDIDLIKNMKEQGKQFPEACYILMQKYYNPATGKMLVSTATFKNWWDKTN